MLSGSQSIRVWQCGEGCGELREKQRFGKPEGAVREVGCGPGSENGSDQEAEGDEAEIEALGAAFFSIFGRAGGVKRVMNSFDCVA